MSSNRQRKYNSYAKPRWEVEKEEAERARLEQLKRNMENTEENFPELVFVDSVAPKVSSVWKGRKFSELAADWKNTDEQKKEEEERRKQEVTNRTEDGVFLLPRFTPSNRFVEQDEKPEPETEKKEVVEEDDESGWVTVDRNAEKQARMARKVRRKEEKLRRMDEGEEPSSSDSEEDEQDDSCWNDKPPEHETCWDDRRP